MVSITDCPSWIPHPKWFDGWWKTRTCFWIISIIRTISAFTGLSIKKRTSTSPRHCKDWIISNCFFAIHFKIHWQSEFCRSLFLFCQTDLQVLVRVIHHYFFFLTIERLLHGWIRTHKVVVNKPKYSRHITARFRAFNYLICLEWCS